MSFGEFQVKGFTGKRADDFVFKDASFLLGTMLVDIPGEKLAEKHGDVNFVPLKHVKNT